MIGITGVDAALIACIDAGPNGDIVAGFYGECGGGVGGVRGRSEGGDDGLRPLFARVEPDCAAEDGEVFGLVDVDCLAGGWIWVLLCGFLVSRLDGKKAGWVGQVRTSGLTGTLIRNVTPLRSSVHPPGVKPMAMMSSIL